MRASINVIASFAAGAWAALVGLLALPVYLRYLGVEAFGLFGFLLTLQAWFLLLDLGLSPTASREMARFTGGQHSGQSIRDLFVSLERIYLLIAVVLAAALVSGSHWLATDWLQLRTLQTDEAARVLSLMAAIVAVQWMATLYRSAINGLQMQVWLGGVTILCASLRAVCTLATLAWIAPTLEAFVLAQAGSYLLEALVMRVYIGRRLPQVHGRFNAAVLRTAWRFAAGMTAITVLATAVSQVDKLLLARLMPLEEFGYFSLAMTVVGALSIVVAPIFSAAYPRLAELVAAGRNQDLADEFHAFSQLASMVLLPAAATLALLGPQAVFAWTGDRVLTARVAPVIAVWVIGTALNGVMHVPYALQLSMGWVRLSIALNLVGAVVTLPAILLLVPQHGAIAAAWVWTTLNFVYFTAGMSFMYRRILRGEQQRWYLQDVSAPGVAAVAVVALCYWLVSALGPLDRMGSAMAVGLALLASGMAAAAATSTGRKLARTALSAAPLRTALRQ